MASVATKKFKIHNAKQFIESIGEAANSNYYLFIGRPLQWTDENSPPTPSDAVANTTFDYWRDAIAFRKIKSTDLTHVIPRNNWTANTIYNMYDHRDQYLLTNSTPHCVLTTNFDVYKCVFNGKNASSSGANSTIEPTGTGNTVITTGDGYKWKYLYTIGTADALSFLTTAYMPVKTLAADDGSAQWRVQSYADTVNGAIEIAVVTNGGSAYSTSPTVTITGDGTGATATATVTANAITAITITAGGSGYSNAVITITDASGSGATAVPMVPPRNGGITAHGKDPINELGGSYVMLYGEFEGTVSNTVTVDNNYRRIGIIKDPLLANGSAALANTYRQTLNLLLTGAVGTFTKDEIVRGQTSGAKGLLVDWNAGGNANTARLVSIEGTFQAAEVVEGIGNGNTSPAISASGATGTVSTITEPELLKYSGEILYIENRSPVTRANDQTELVKIILSY